MIIQTYEYKGIQLESALKVTSFKVTPVSADANDIEIIVNRYTNSSCCHDIEQFTKTFKNLPNSAVPLDSIPELEALLILEPGMENAEIV